MNPPLARARLNRAFASLGAVVCMFAFCIPPVCATPVDDLRNLLREHFEWAQKEDPGLARDIGNHAYDDRVKDVSLAAEDRRAAVATEFIHRLSKLPDEQLSTVDRVNKQVLSRLLTRQVEANRFGQRAIVFSSINSPWLEQAGEGESGAFRNGHDYRSYLTRLAQFPRTNDQLLAITTQAIAGGYVLPCSATGGLEASLRLLVRQDTPSSRFYAPFLRAAPADVSETEWQALKAHASALITDALNPAYLKAADFMHSQYLPKCSKTEGLGSQPGGAAYYAFLVREETTTNLTPGDIHRIGSAEVERIRALMEAVARKAGFPNRAAFIHELRTNPRYYAKSRHELLAEASLQAKRIDGLMPRLFHTLSRLPYGVTEFPAEGAEKMPTAMYRRGSVANGVAGYFLYNTSSLDQRPLWETPVLTAHEAVPGHHHQQSIQQELDLPPLRRYLAEFTAFGEGWGLYAESLGDDIGLYDTPEKQMGRLSYEIWRACRMVVDTGIHSKGWTKARAIAYMTENTALSSANIEAEVNRYISWPGQAVSYKVGEMKFRELRNRAQKALGPRFDLAAFHDALIGQGMLPLDVLDEQINLWIEARATRTGLQ